MLPLVRRTCVLIVRLGTDRLPRPCKESDEKKGWEFEDIVREWTGLDFPESQRDGEDEFINE